MELIQGISGELESFASLSAKIRTLDQDVREKVHIIEKEQQFYRAVIIWAVPLLVAAAVACTSWFLRGPSTDQHISAELRVAATNGSASYGDDDLIQNPTENQTSTEISKNSE